MFDRVCIGLFVYLLTNDVTRTYFDIGIGIESLVGTCALVLALCWIVFRREGNFFDFLIGNTDRVFRWVCFPTFSFMTYQLLAIPGTLAETGMFFATVTVLFTLHSFWRFSTLFDEFHKVSTKPGENTT